MTLEEISAIRAQFEKKVNKRSRSAMVKFLAEHFRYHTMNSWNRSTSYAHCIKIHHINWPKCINKDVLYELCESCEWSLIMRDRISIWECSRKSVWQIGTNGRSSGYLVLYQGGIGTDGRRFCYPGKSLDMHESFQESDGWDMGSLRDRVELVQEFDALAADLAVEYASLAEIGHFEDDTVTVERKIRKYVENR